MEGLSGKQSSVPEDEMERGWGEEIQTSVVRGMRKSERKMAAMFISKSCYNRETGNIAVSE